MNREVDVYGYLRQTLKILVNMQWCHFLLQNFSFWKVIFHNNRKTTSILSICGRFAIITLLNKLILLNFVSVFKMVNIITYNIIIIQTVSETKNICYSVQDVKRCYMQSLMTKTRNKQDKLPAPCFYVKIILNLLVGHQQQNAFRNTSANSLYSLETLPGLPYLKEH